MINLLLSLLLSLRLMHLKLVIPANADIQASGYILKNWIPVFTGITAKAIVCFKIGEIVLRSCYNVPYQ